MTFAQHVQDIRGRFRPGDPSAVQALLRRCGQPLRQVVRRALRTHAPGTRLGARVQQLVSTLNHQPRGSSPVAVSLSQVCQGLAKSILWGEGDVTATFTRLSTESWLDARAGT